jgi:hypothetical protein
VACEIDPHRAGLDPLALARRRGPVELSPTELGAHAAQQLSDRERLGDVVVGTDLQADDLVDLGVLGGQQDDRHRAPRAHIAADVEPASSRHHDVEDQEVEAGSVDAQLAVGVGAVLSQGDVEALLLERVAHRITNRGLVVGDQDPAVGHLDHAIGVGAG